MFSRNANHDQPPTKTEQSVAKRLRSLSSKSHSSKGEDTQQLPRKSDKNPSSRRPSHEKPSKQELQKKIKQHRKIHPKSELDDEHEAAMDAATIMATQEAAMRSYMSSPAMSTQDVLSATGQIPTSTRKDSVGLKPSSSSTIAGMKPGSTSSIRFAGPEAGLTTTHRGEPVKHLSPPPRQEVSVSINHSPNGSTNPKLNNSAERLQEQQAQFEKELKAKDLEMERLRTQLSDSKRRLTPATSTKDMQNVRTEWPKYPHNDDHQKTGSATRLELANAQAELARLQAAETLRKTMESQNETLKERERKLENDHLQEKLRLLTIQQDQNLQRVRDEANANAEKAVNEKANTIAQSKIQEATARLEEQAKLIELRAKGAAFTDEAKSRLEKSCQNLSEANRKAADDLEI